MRDYHRHAKCWRVRGFQEIRFFPRGDGVISGDFDGLTIVLHRNGSYGNQTERDRRDPVRMSRLFRLNSRGDLFVQHANVLAESERRTTILVHHLQVVTAHLVGNSTINLEDGVWIIIIVMVVSDILSNSTWRSSSDRRSSMRRSPLSSLRSTVRSWSSRRTWSALRSSRRSSLRSSRRSSTALISSRRSEDWRAVSALRSSERRMSARRSSRRAVSDLRSSERRTSWRSTDLSARRSSRRAVSDLRSSRRSSERRTFWRSTDLSARRSSRRAVSDLRSSRRSAELKISSANLFYIYELCACCFIT